MAVLYRAEHVGSLLRPAVLLQARAAHAEGKLTLGGLRSMEDRAIEEALRKQRDIGLEIFSDGEMRRASWLTDMAEAVEGFAPHRVELEWKGPGGGREGSTALAAGATLPAPSNFLIASYKPGVTDKVYPSQEEFLADLVVIVRDDIAWLVSEGAAYIEAARYMPLDNLAISPQCGFASIAAGNLLSMDDQWRKLELVVDTARRVWT